MVGNLGVHVVGDGLEVNASSVVGTNYRSELSVQFGCKYHDVACLDSSINFSCHVLRSRDAKGLLS